MLKYKDIINSMKKEEKSTFRYNLVKFAARFGIRAASREYHTHRNVVRTWLRRYQKEGLTALKDLSKKPLNSPNKCPEDFENQVITLRKETKCKFGAKRLKERFDLQYSKNCIQRIINQNNLKRKRKSKRKKRNELWSVKRLTKLFDKIQIDVKVLTDIAQYYPAYIKHKLPKFEFTARCVKTGASFVCFANKNTSDNAAIFAAYLLQHLKDYGFDVSKILIQTDNGPEFNACGKLKKHTKFPFEYIVKDTFGAQLGHIPPASPTFNSDVETFHRLVEDEFYAIEDISSSLDLRKKMYTFLIDFNFLRKNSYKDNKTPFDLAIQDFPNISKQLFNLPPIILDDHWHYYYHTYLYKKTAKDLEKERIAAIVAKNDPFKDPNFRAFVDKWGVGHDLSGLHNLTENIDALYCY